MFDKNTYDYTLTVGLDTTKLAFCKAYASDNTLCGTLFNFYPADEKNSYSLMMLIFGTVEGVVTELTINDEEVDANSLFNYMLGTEESGEDYLLTELKEGDNIIKFNMDNKVYTITIVRKEIIEDTENTETPVEPKGTKEDTKEVVTNNSNNNINNTGQNKQFDILKEVPNTGILLSISLSVVSIILIGLMYYKYYNKKKTNI